MKKKIIGYSVAAIFVVAIVLGLASVVVTYNDEYKLVRAFGKVDRVITEPGLSFKIPFVEETDTIPNKILIYDLAKSDVITMDKKTMVTDTYVLWKINDPLLFAQSLSSSVTNAESRINTAVYNSMKTVFGSMSQADVISARDGLLSQKISENIGENMDQYGISLVSIETKQLDLPNDNKAAVYERMISEREQMAASYTAEGNSNSQIIKNTTDKDISIMLSEANAKAASIVAEGEAEYMRVLSEAYADTQRSSFYTFVRALDAAKVSLTGDNKTLILPSTSPIAQIFLGN